MDIEHFSIYHMPPLLEASLQRLLHPMQTLSVYEDTSMLFTQHS